MEITRSTLLVSKKGILCLETTGTSFSLTPKSFAINFATSTSYPSPPGFKSNMPGFEETLSDDQIWAVLAYIKSKWPEQIRRRHALRNKP